MRCSPATILIAVLYPADLSSAQNTKGLSTVPATPAITQKPSNTGTSSSSFSLTSLPLPFPYVTPAMSLAVNLSPPSIPDAHSSRYISRSVASKEHVYFSDQVSSRVGEFALGSPPSQKKLTITVNITVAHFFPPPTASSQSAAPTTTVTSYVLVVPMPMATAHTILEGKGQEGIFTNDNSTFRQFDDKPVQQDNSRHHSTWLLPLLIALSILAGFIFGSGFWCYYRKYERFSAAIHDMSTFPDSGTVRCVLMSPLQALLLIEMSKQSRAWRKFPARPKRLNMNLAQNWSFNRSDVESQPGPPYPHGNWTKNPELEMQSSPLSSTTTMIDHSQHIQVHYPDPTMGNTPIRPRALTDPLIPRLPSYEAALKGDDGVRYVSPLLMSGAYPSTVRSRPSTSSAATSLRSEGWESMQSRLGGVNTLGIHTRSVRSARSNRSLRRAQQMQHMDASLRHIGAY
jgi:hypothetical protein